MDRKGDFFFKFKFKRLKTQCFSVFSESGPLPNLDAQKNLAFRQRETPIISAHPETTVPPVRHAGRPCLGPALLNKRTGPGRVQLLNRIL